MSWFSSSNESPSKSHWVPSEENHSCSIPSCQSEFSLFNRKHHCRRCGEIVCGNHFGKIVKLNKFAVPDENGIESPVCDHCFYSHVKRLKIMRGETLEAKQTETRFVLPPAPENLIIPEEIIVYGESVFLSILISELKNDILYFDQVRENLVNFKDSFLKRQYIEAEKSNFETNLKEIEEMEKTIGKVLSNPLPDPRLSSYLYNCTLSLQPIKNWLCSTEIYLLRNGMKLPQEIGSLPEDDFAIVEDKILTFETMAEGLMVNLFDVSEEEQARMIKKLNWIKAKLDHDLFEYSLIPGSEMHSFQERIQKSIQYIDLYLDISNGSSQLEDFQSNLSNYETAFLHLEKDVASIGLDETNIDPIKEKYVNLLRDVNVFEGVLIKSSEGSPKTRTKMSPPPEKVRPLIAKLEALRNKILLLEEKIEIQTKAKEKLSSKASELYQGLQVRRANERRERIEEEMFDL